MGRKTTLFSNFEGDLCSRQAICWKALYFIVYFFQLRFDSEKTKHALGLLQTNGVTSFSVGGKRYKKIN